MHPRNFSYVLLVLVLLGAAALGATQVRSRSLLSVSNPALARPADSIAQSPAPDALVLTARPGGHLGTVLADETMAYASFDFRIHSYDLTNPSAPRHIATRPQINGIPQLLPGNLARLARRGDFTYGLVDWDRPPPIDEDSHVIFVVLDQWLNVAGTLELPGFTRAHFTQLNGWQPQAQELAPLGNRHVLVADTGADGHRLRVIDVSQPARPLLVGSVTPEGLPIGLATAGDFAYLLEEDYQNDIWQVAVLDLSDATAPTLLRRIPTVDRAMDLAIGDGHAFVVGCGGLEAYSLADPAQPRLVGMRRSLNPQPAPATPGPNPSPSPTPSPPIEGGFDCDSETNVQWREGRLYAVTYEIDDLFNPFAVNTVLWEFDVRQPESPGLSSLTRWPGHTGRLAVGDGFAVASSSREGMRVIDLSRPAQPRVGATLAGGRMIVEALAAAPGLVVQNAVFGFGSELQFIVPEKGIVSRLEIGELEMVIDIEIEAGRVYAVVDARKLLVVDARDPAVTPPRLIATIPAIADMVSAEAVGDRLYIAEADKDDGSVEGGLRVLVLSDPGRPVQVARAPGSFQSVAVSGDHVFAGSVDAPEIHVFKIATDSGVTSLTPVGEVKLESSARRLIVEGRRLYAVDQGTHLQVIDATDPDHPRLVGQLDLVHRAEPWFGRAVGLAARGDVVYAGSFDALQTIDASDPAAPRRVAIRAIPSQSLIDGPLVDRFATGGQVAVAGHDVHFAGDMTGLWSFRAGTLPGTTERFEGLYWANFEHSQFSPAVAGCAPDTAWWYLFMREADDFERRYRTLYPDYRRIERAGHTGYVWARFEGRVTPPSPTEFPWSLERAITVSRVLDMWKVPGCAYAPPPRWAIYVPLGSND